MNPYNEYLVQQQHIKDLERAAEHERLVRLALAGKRTPNRFRTQFIPWLWKQIVALGCSIQDFFGTLFPKSTETPVYKPCWKQENVEQ